MYANPKIDPGQFAVIIPSFNESENLAILVKRIKAELPKANIFIVDDSSEEGYNELLKTIIERSNVTFFHRNRKSGRGSAVVFGIKKALADKHINYFFEMDADLSHDPKDIRQFINAIREGRTDVVIGSRYIRSSSITEWPLYRRVGSKAINSLLNRLFNLQLTDYTNGFRLYNRRAAEFLQEIHLREKGFIMLSETAYKLSRAGFILSEVPVHFTDRKFGKSSVGTKEILSSLFGVLRIRFLS